MATAESPGTQALPGHGDEGGGQARIEIPTVAAVVVTRNPGPWLERALGSLRSQDYPSVAVLVVDAASDEDPSDRIAGALPEAFVRRVPHSGFAAAANEALYTIRNANFLLICHDDVVLDAAAVRLMLEEAFRSNAAIVGPKIVDADNPEVLLEVGRSIDRFGNPHTGIEPGELDQEQHDGVRDVFYVSDTAMLVRTDLFHELGGFDASRFPGAEDLDLCWRARLAGARVLVAPDARVQHHQAAGDRGDGAALDAATMARNRIRTVLTLSSAKTLLWVVPVGVAAAFVEALLLTITLRRGRVRSALGAWWWNLRHFRGIRRARRQARRDRRIDDRELHDLRARGARLRALVRGRGPLRCERGNGENPAASVRAGRRARARLGHRLAPLAHRRRPGRRHIRALAGNPRHAVDVRFGLAVHGPRLVDRRATGTRGDGRYHHGPVRRRRSRSHTRRRARVSNRRVRRIPVDARHHATVGPCGRCGPRVRDQSSPAERGRRRAPRAARAVRAGTVRDLDGGAARGAGTRRGAASTRPDRPARAGRASRVHHGVVSARAAPAARGGSGDHPLGTARRWRPPRRAGARRVGRRHRHRGPVVGAVVGGAARRRGRPGRARFLVPSPSRPRRRVALP